jgi:CzcA family heavy metal efflux pump
MLNRIIGFSLRNRITVVIGAMILLVAGGFITSDMDIDVFPELTAPTVVIMTQAPGMAAEEVEKLVTFPIETSVNGATGLRRVRSGSSMGFSIVWAEFNWKTDIYDARQTVTERLIQVSEELPLGAGKPMIAPQASLLGEMMIIGLRSDSLSPTDLRTVAEWTVRPRLLSIPGVSQVTTIGGDAREYQILADPYRMNFYGISMEELAAATRGINENSSGGFINEYGNIYLVRGMARTTDPEEIGSSVTGFHNGEPVRIRDVAEVKAGASPRIGAASYNGMDAVLINITKQPGVNTVKLTGEITGALEDIGKHSGGTFTLHNDIYNQAEFINTSVRNVLRAIAEGGIFVVVILFVFLLNVRTTIISLLAIPLSLLFSIVVLHLLGYTINTMSLGGMAIAIGSLVDDAIIDVENVYKRLRQNAVLPKSDREKPLKVIYEASVEIRPSILNATLIIIITFMPLFFLQGFEGRMLKPLGISFIVSLFASLMVAVTVTPVMCSYLLTGNRRLRQRAKGSWVERNLTRLYQSLLTKSLNRNRVITGVSALGLAVAAALFFTLGNTFLPPFNEGALTINLASSPGTNLEESARAAAKAEKAIMEFPEVISVARKTGRAEMAEHSFSENVSELDVPFTLGERSREQFFADVREALSEIPGLSVEVGQPITHRMDHMVSGTKANIAIKIFGDDLNTLYQTANNIRDEIAEIDGIGDLTVEQLTEAPQLKIRANREMLSRYGIPMTSFTGFIKTAIAGEKVSDMFEGDSRFPLVLRFNEESRSSADAIKDAMIDTGYGNKIPLSMVASVESSAGAYSINRENVRRRIVVSVNVADRDVGSVVDDIEQRIEEHVTLPDNYFIEYSGQFESAASASRTLLVTSLIALVLIFVILYQEFHNTRLALIILLNLPLALIGGIFALKISSGVLSIPSIIGFITLFGIATRNGLLLVSRYEALRHSVKNLKERIITGSADRLNPILMTALTAALALIPLAIGGDKPGNEIQSPMAVVILGGLLSSTLLNIFVIPSVYYLVNRKGKKSTQ